jgi:plastocyanin
MSVQLSRSVAMTLVGMLSLAAPAAGASITGNVRYVGPPVEPVMVPVTIDQYVCGKEKVAEDLVLSPRKGVKNAVVYLQSPPAGAKPESAPAATTEMDQRQCAFAPRVVIVPAGGTVEFLNSDRLLHNLHTVSKDNPRFNRSQPKGRTIPIVMARPEFVRVDCDLHSWMRGWVVVTEHPYYALTTDDGAFTIANVPAGKYTLAVWHERLGTLTRDITVTDPPSPVTIELGRK